MAENERETGSIRRLPMARKDKLVVQELPDETLVYDQERHKAHCLNPVAALIWKQCDGLTSVSEAAALLGSPDRSADAEAAVLLALDQLAKANLLNEASAVVTGGETAERPSISRRRLLQRFGLAAAAAVPLVSSIVAPTPAQAGSLQGSGASCSTGAQCTSGVCMGSECM